MTPKGLELCVHPPGECDQDMVVDTPGGRFRIDYDEELPVSPVGPLVFFAQFLQASGHFEALCEHAPLTYTSPNAPDKRAVLATMVLGVLSGCRRFAQLEALRYDTLAAGMMGGGGSGE